MGREQTVPVLMRATGTAPAVNDAGWTETVINVPRNCRMRRLRAIITAGTGTQVAIQLREEPGVATGLPVVEDIPLTATPISVGGPKYCIANMVPGPTGQTIPVLYVAVMTDSATPAVDTVEFSVDFESCSS